MASPPAARDRLIFAFMIAPGLQQRQALMLAESLRAFAGSYSGSPMWVLVPKSEAQVSRAVRERLVALHARLIPFQVDPSVLLFPFAGKVFAAAAAEWVARGQTQSLARAEADFLVWMDSDSLILGEPGALLLDKGKNLGYRPVDHTLIGSPYDRPIDDFWALVYRHCAVPAARLFPMTTTVDRNCIRAYFNAGLLVVRPTRGLLQRWRDNLQRACRAPDYEPFYRENPLYRIFLHQAVLAATVLATMDPQELQELPDRVNYPLHLHTEYPPDRRVAFLNELVTCRYDVFFQDAAWRQRLAVQEPLQSWLDERLGAVEGSTAG